MGKTATTTTTKLESHSTSQGCISRRKETHMQFVSKLYLETGGGEGKEKRKKVLKQFEAKLLSCFVTI